MIGLIPELITFRLITNEGYTLLTDAGQVHSILPIRKLAMTLDYLFGRGVSKSVRAENTGFTYSRKTGRIRQIFMDDKLFATLRSDGSLALTIHGARILIVNQLFKSNLVMVTDEARNHISEGRSVFARHVLEAGERIRPKAEVVVIDRNGELLAVGRAVISAKMMLRFKRGVAVKVRKGILNSLDG